LPIEVTNLVHDPLAVAGHDVALRHEYLYVTANQLFNQPSMHGDKALRKKPYVLFRIKVDAKPIRLQ
jgi:sugar lactone lactonase YvrE